MMKQDDPNLLPIDVAIRQAKEAATDAEWNGRPSNHFWGLYYYLKERKRNGAEWEPLF